MIEFTRQQCKVEDELIYYLYGTDTYPVEALALSLIHIFQNYNLVPILNVYENIVLPVELDGDTVDQKFLDEVVTMLGLERCV